MEQYIKNLYKTLGDNLLFAASYGVSQEYLVLVVQKIDVTILSMIKPLAKRINYQPLLLTEEEINKGVDVFPLEFLNIQQTLKILHGNNIFSKLKIEKKFVRRELEFEFRSKLINVRQGFLEVRNKKELKIMLEKSLPTLLPLFRGLLYIKGKKVPEEARKISDEVMKEYGVDFSLLLDLHDGKALRHGNFSSALGMVMDLLLVIGKKVDMLKI